MIFDTLTQKITEKKNPTCVGLDTQKGHVPEEIAKKYEDEKVVSFINGILGAFVRAEFPEQGRPKATSDPKEA